MLIKWGWTLLTKTFPDKVSIERKGLQVRNQQHPKQVDRK